MGTVTLTIDNKEVKAEEGMTILQAARKAGIHIPTLCHHDELKYYTACRICMVEIEKRGRTSLDTACSCPVEDKIVVRTRSENLNKIRKTLLELMLAHAPDSPILLEMAREYGADKDRFEKSPSFCILCGLCVRYCAEVAKKNAIGFVDRGVRREIAFVPEVAAKECWKCKGCFPLCPTEYLQATFVLTQALSPVPFSTEASG
ncbi:MAG: (2Fe-2S)-binding protein [Chloroflexi bacterium RBG_16_57_8]|nr:MAG: (2Fe-2S)-binding protein [Chloroflexi bacterium RBG_16_57_8]